MSFIGQNQENIGYKPGWFLVDCEDCTRLTKTIAADHAQVQTAQNGGKYVPMGAIYPSNDGEAVGIVYEDVDVTTGDMPGSVVTHGIVYKNRLFEAPAAGAVTALEAAGIKFIETEPVITRPY